LKLSHHPFSIKHCWSWTHNAISWSAGSDL